MPLKHLGIVKTDKTRIIFEKEIPKDAFQELKDDNFIWIIFIFDQCDSEKYQVRPPRLGGNKKIGVYATRSPFRPNNIGLSLCRINKMEYNNNQMIFTVEGLDLADKTSVIDIKPYHPVYDRAWADSEYWFGEANVKKLPVIFPESLKIPSEDLKFIEDVLCGDPRPAYHDDENRIYKIELLNYDIDFRFHNNQIIVERLIRK